MSSTRARAIFVATIMVISVVGMTAAFAGSAAAQQVTVGSSGDYSTIQDAVDTEGSDTIIEVTDGTYDETVTFDSDVSNVTIEASDASNPPEITGGISIKASVSDLTVQDVILSGDAGASRTFQVAGGSLTDVTFDGVTFEGDDSVNSALYGNSFGGNVTLTDVTAANYTVDDWRFVNINTQSGLNSVEITGSTFRDSVGMIAFGEISNSVTIEDNTFEGIEADSSGSAAAALALGPPALGDSAVASISDNTFTDNFNHVVLGEVDGESIQSVVDSNDFDLAAYDDRLISPSIQNAVDSADSDETVSVEPGTYEESVRINQDNLTLEASGNSGSERVLKAPSSGSGNGITVNASNLTVRDLRITDYSNGIRLVNAHSDVVFENVDSVGNDVRGMEIRNSADFNNLVLKNVNFSNNDGDGLRGATTSSINGLSITDSSFNNNVLSSGQQDRTTSAQGITFFQSESTPGQLNDVTISDTEFIDNGGKAIYTEKLSNATFDNITVDGVVRDTYGFNNGIDINLKYDDYENITIRDSTVANVSEGDPYNDNPSFSAAIGIKARDDPGSYDGNPATLNDVTIENVVIEDSFNGLRIGEPGVDYSASPQGPTGVTITDSTFRGMERYSVQDVPGDLDLNVILNSQGNTFDREVTVEDGAGSITGGTIFAGIQPAVNAASSGQTVSVGPGTYEESVTIETEKITLKGVGEPTIVGAGTSEGSQPHAAIHVNDGSGPVQDVTISGFTVRNPSGKYGIFAGTGSTNKAPDGIGGLVIQNTTVENVSTQVTGSALTGGPAGIGIRADYGTDGNPGIEIKKNEISDVQNSNGPEPVGITLKSFTGDAGFGFDSNGDPVTDASSPPATDTDIVNNTISNISSDGGYATKGISISGEFEDVDVINNDITGIESPGGTALGITLSENGGSYSGNKYDIDDDGSGERIGPRDFEIRSNTIDQVDADSPRAVNIGGYEDLNGDGQNVVSGNNIEDGVVSRVFYTQPGFDADDADILDATENWWGDEDGPNNAETTGAVGEVATQPFLTAPTEELENTDDGTPRRFGTELRLQGGVNTIAFPAPSERTLDESLNTTNVEHVLKYDNTAPDGDNPWDGTSGETPGALNVYVVIVEEGETASLVMEFNNSFDEKNVQLGSTGVSGGWNLVSPTEAADSSSSAFATRNANIQLASENPFQDPQRQPFEADTYEYSPYRGYWVFIDEEDGDSRVASANYDGLTLQEYLENVNLDEGS